ncbi:hypothetical protein ACNQVK_01565 [Mycobacterium sp. 134]|uniref:hypothetical protein n=1 Tax=Mycobacterium sp. 134 TaxID=3400425 RepID=UPI003AAD4B1D
MSGVLADWQIEFMNRPLAAAPMDGPQGFTVGDKVRIRAGRRVWVVSAVAEDHVVLWRQDGPGAKPQTRTFGLPASPPLSDLRRVEG